VAKEPYESFDGLVSDMWVMFDNACRYNEPDSALYKDALTLQKVLIKTKNRVRAVGAIGEESAVPDVDEFVLDLLTQLFAAIYEHQVRVAGLIMQMSYCRTRTVGATRTR